MDKKLLEMSLGEHAYLPEGNEWSHGEPCMLVRCTGGWIMSRPQSDPGCYSEFYLDFITEDNRLLQLAVVGRDEGKDDGTMREIEPCWQPMHVYAYDGTDECVKTDSYVTIGDESFWYER